MASIRFITAPIGGGKSLFGTIQICEELERTDRLIVTNIPLILHIASSPERTLDLVRMLAEHKAQNARQASLYWTIAEYCHVFINRPINVRERLVCITEEQTKEFWRYIPRGGISDEEAAKHGVEPWRNESEIRPSYGWKLPNTDHKQYNFVPDFTFRQANPNGVYYVLDEVHQHFPARFWQGLGPQAERYMSQLRKLNDDLDLLTQHPEKVDKNFRRNATDWMQVENMGNKTLFMGVSLPNRFRYHWYNQAEMPTRFEKPTKSGWYKIEGHKRHQWLYKTAEGVGVAGGIIAEEKRFKGKPVWIWAVPIVLGFILAFYLPRLVENGVRIGFSAGANSIMRGVSSGLKNITPTNAALPAPVIHSPQPISPAVSVPSVHWKMSRPIETEPRAEINFAPAGIYAVGFNVMGTNTWVELSDGSICKSENGEVQAVGEKFVRVNGWEKIPLRRSP